MLQLNEAQGCLTQFPCMAGNSKDGWAATNAKCNPTIPPKCICIKCICTKCISAIVFATNAKCDSLALQFFLCHSMQWIIGSWRLYERLSLEVGQVLTRALDLVAYEAHILQIREIYNDTIIKVFYFLHLYRYINSARIVGLG